MIIDIHAHTSKYPMYGLHTDSARLETLEQMAANHNIERIYIMATYFPLKKSGVHNQDLLEQIKEKPLFGCFGSLDFEKPLNSALSELRDLAEKRLIAGIKLYPGYQNIKLDAPEVFEVCQIAYDYALPVAIHTGELHHCCREYKNKKNLPCGFSTCLIDERADYSHPVTLKNIASNFSKVPFIACHMANPHFDELRDTMKTCPNIYTDMSGQFVSASHEDTKEYKNFILQEIEKTIKERGIERMLFGTDFPIQSYQDSINLISNLPLNANDKDMIFYKNAKNLFAQKSSFF